eukprot:CAMPEP_0175057806 /NCGR_PEP_ID=MMETSP0052_2-20121109/11471_1 /TAXON_ID=51329 ORGANISM="Polytomella parva, Strain SAG 63-3" /NCGR_SAMPLE_ID=MMETSP0052_2 /ASSEMBLY_ACC=CAM_ASM_000194 /LENGTH=93 /DNA_ID=CAMNT_0016323065 /DNA_START=445 /DNA_END=723 /DNA_ORIENTATION=+
MDEVNDDFDSIMSEMQRLSNLRNQLKTEFENIGAGEAVAGLQTLTNFLKPGTAVQLSDGNWIQQRGDGQVVEDGDGREEERRAWEKWGEEEEE